MVLDVVKKKKKKNFLTNTKVAFLGKHNAYP